MSLIEQERDAERSTSRASARTSRSCRVSSAGDPRVPRQREHHAAAAAGHRRRAEFYERHNANAHRAVYTLGEEATELFEGARSRIAGFLGAATPESIVFNCDHRPINLVAHAWGRRYLREGDEILLTEMEHHSDIVPGSFARDTGADLKYIPLTDEGLLDLSGLDALLTERTKILAVTGMSNSLGTLPPLRQLIDAAHAVGAVVLVDGAQLGFPTAPSTLPSWTATSSRSAGTRVRADGLRRAVRQARAPRGDGSFLGGGEMIREVYHDHSTWNAVPYKFEAGTRTSHRRWRSAPPSTTSRRWGWTCRAGTRGGDHLVRDRPVADAGAETLGPTDPGIRGGAVSFWYKDVHPTTSPPSSTRTRSRSAPAITATSW